MDATLPRPLPTPLARLTKYAGEPAIGHHQDVIVPVLIKESEPEEEPLEEKRDRAARLVGFKVVRAVFGVSDTEGADLPPVETPGWDVQKALGKLGIREAPFDSTDGNLQGYSYGLEFAINPIAVNPNKTRMHELGHIILGHTMPHHHEEYALHRGLMEFEAEATAYLVMNEMGQLDDETASHSRGYIRHWLQDEQPPEQSIRRVFRAAEAILKAGELTATLTATQTTVGDSRRQAATKRDAAEC